MSMIGIISFFYHMNTFMKPKLPNLDLDLPEPSPPDLS